MTFFHKYNLYKALKNNLKPISYKEHFTHDTFETVTNEGVKVLSEKIEPDFHDEGITYHLSLTSKTGEYSKHKGIFARVIYMLLRNRYKLKAGNNR